jgi:hypothetical protein
MAYQQVWPVIRKQTQASGAKTKTPGYEPSPKSSNTAKRA